MKAMEVMVSLCNADAVFLINTERYNESPCQHSKHAATLWLVC